jgi:hypothetical protein
VTICHQGCATSYCAIHLGWSRRSYARSLEYNVFHAQLRLFHGKLAYLFSRCLFDPLAVLGVHANWEQAAVPTFTSFLQRRVHLHWDCSLGGRHLHCPHRQPYGEYGYRGPVRAHYGRFYTCTFATYVTFYCFTLPKWILQLQHHLHHPHHHPHFRHPTITPQQRFSRQTRRRPAY